jgi:hypothetical protein
VLYRQGDLSNAQGGHWTSDLWVVLTGIRKEHTATQAVALGLTNKNNFADAVTDIAKDPTLIGMFLQSATSKSIINRNGMMACHGVPQMPLYIHREDNDELSSTSDNTELYNEYCGNGASVWYRIYHVCGTDPACSPHLAEGAQALLLGRMLDRFARIFGGTFPTGCRIENNAQWRRWR